MLIITIFGLFNGLWKGEHSRRMRINGARKCDVSVWEYFTEYIYDMKNIIDNVWEYFVWIDILFQWWKLVEVSYGCEVGLSLFYSMLLY